MKNTRVKSSVPASPVGPEARVASTVTAGGDDCASAAEAAPNTIATSRAIAMAAMDPFPAIVGRLNAGRATRLFPMAWRIKPWLLCSA